MILRSVPSEKIPAEGDGLVLIAFISRNDSGLVPIPGVQSRPQESAQGDKWSFCLTAGTLCPANQERQ
jgi:hypothetical protein